MSEQILDLRRSLTILRRHRRVVVAFAALGVAGGLAFATLRPAPYAARALVLLPTSSANSGTSSKLGNALDTDAQIARSAAVLNPAAHNAGYQGGLAALRREVQANATTSAILAIDVAAPGPREAMRLANAVARQLVTFVTSSGLGSGAQAVAGLQGEATQLTSQTSNLDRQIAAVETGTAPANQNGRTLLTTLIAERSQSSLQLNIIESQISEAKLAGALANGGTEVIQWATVAVPPSSLRLPELGILGAIGGLLVACIAVLARRRSDPRLSQRDELAEAVGAPVILSLVSRRRRSVRDWVVLFQSYEPSATERWNVRKALQGIGAADPASARGLHIVALAGDWAAAAAAIEVAVTTNSLGTQTTFAISGNHVSIATLRAANDRLWKSRTSDAPGDSELMCLKPSGEDGEIPDLGETAGLIILAQFVEGSRPAIVSPGSGWTTVLAVSAGFTTGDELALVAMAAADVATPIKGVLVTNPDPTDRSTGRVGQIVRPLNQPLTKRAGAMDRLSK